MSVFAIDSYKYAVPAPADPDFSSVSLLMHCDGSDGSTAFVDDSLNSHVLTAFGSAAISTTQQRFGTGSALFGVGAGNFVAAPANTSFNFGSGDFTIEFWHRMTSADVSGSARFLAQGRTAASTFSYSLGWDSFFASYLFSYSSNGSSLSTQYFTISPTADIWQHLALVRSSGIVNLYLNGVRGTVVDQSVTASFFAGGDLRIGSEGLSNSGYMDEIRITKGVARYTASTFTPPTAAFPDS